MSTFLISRRFSLSTGSVHRMCDPGCQILIVCFEIKILSTIELKYFFTLPYLYNPHTVGFEENRCSLGNCFGMYLSSELILSAN